MEGLRFTVKDCFRVEGFETSFGLRPSFLPIATQNAELINEICEAGAALVGITNLTPLALGANNENRMLGEVKFASVSPEQILGSSTGSAIAVKSGFCEFSICSDSGGSSRIPAVALGLIGYKAGRGQLNKQGMLSVAPEIDEPGIITSDMQTLGRILEVLVPSFLQRTIDSPKERLDYRALRTSEQQEFDTLFEKAHQIRKRFIAYGLKEALSGWKGDTALLSDELLALEKFGRTLSRSLIDELGDETKVLAEKFIKLKGRGVVLVTPALGADLRNITKSDGRVNHFMALSNLLGYPAVCVPLRSLERKILSVQIVAEDLKTVWSGASELLKESATI